MLPFLSWRLNALERALAALRRRAIERGRVPWLAPHLEMGQRGEQAALFHLRREGYVVVARRWRNARQRGDLDLVAWEGDVLCFIEVKTRVGGEVASAESAVDEDKRKIVRRLARLYLKAVDPPPAGVRFDVVSVYLGKERREILLLRSAFGWVPERLHGQRP